MNLLSQRCLHYIQTGRLYFICLFTERVETNTLYNTHANKTVFMVTRLKTHLSLSSFLLVARIFLLSYKFKIMSSANFQGLKNVFKKWSENLSTSKYV